MPKPSSTIFSRREFMQLLGVSATGLYLAGCASDQQVLQGRPGPDWPEVGDRPVTHGSGSPVGSPTSVKNTSRPQATYTNQSAGVTHAPTSSPDMTPVSVGSLKPLPRSSWAKAKPNPQKILAMGGVSLITVHHEGWTPVTFTDAVTTAARLESIRRSHLERLGAGDIGYHYVIDRAGRLWQGRDVRYQGAHVREHNPHNIGIMCLGNFDSQRPTDAQYAALQKTLAGLMKQYKVPVKYVYTHQELNKTECPGSVLQNHMRSLRKGGIV